MGAVAKPKEEPTMTETHLKTMAIAALMFLALMEFFSVVDAINPGEVPTRP